MTHVPTRYSAEELHWLQEHSTLPRDEYHRQFVQRFARTDVTVWSLFGVRRRNGWKVVPTHRFQKGNVPFYKGRKRPGTKPSNFKGAGHERVCIRDGFVILTLEEPNPTTGTNTRHEYKHRHLWEKANGPLPEGMVLKNLDGDLANTDPSNWEPIPRGVLNRLRKGKETGRNYDHAPAEIRPTIMAVAKLEHRIAEHRRAGRSAR